MSGKAFLKKTGSIDLSSKLSLTYGGNVNYYKSVHHLIPTLPVPIPTLPTLLWSKEPIKEQIILDFQVLESKFVKFLMLVLKWQVDYSSVFVSFFIVMAHNSSVNLRSYIF